MIFCHKRNMTNATLFICYRFFLFLLSMSYLSNVGSYCNLLNIISSMAFTAYFATFLISHFRLFWLFKPTCYTIFDYVCCFLFATCLLFRLQSRFLFFIYKPLKKPLLLIFLRNCFFVQTNFECHWMILKFTDSVLWKRFQNRKGVKRQFDFTFTKFKLANVWNFCILITFAIRR